MAQNTSYFLVKFITAVVAVYFCTDKVQTTTKPTKSQIRNKKHIL